MQRYDEINRREHYKDLARSQKQAETQRLEKQKRKFVE
jgi:hypothetical protein